MIIGISGKRNHGKGKLAIVLQYVIYCNEMLRKHPTFKYPVESFIKHLDLQKSKYSLEAETGWQIKSIGSKIKQCASIILGIPLEDFDDDSIKQMELDGSWMKYYYTDFRGKKIYTDIIEPNPDFHVSERMTVGNWLDNFSSDACRHKVHGNFWINTMFKDYERTCVSTYDDHTSVLKYHPVFDKGSGHLFTYPNWIIKDLKHINEADAITRREGIVFRINDSSVESTDTDDDALDDYKFDAVFNNESLNSVLKIEALISQAQQHLKQFKII